MRWSASFHSPPRCSRASRSLLRPFPGRGDPLPGGLVRRLVEAEGGDLLSQLGLPLGCLLAGPARLLQRLLDLGTGREAALQLARPSARLVQPRLLLASSHRGSRRRRRRRRALRAPPTSSVARSALSACSRARLTTCGRASRRARSRSRGRGPSPGPLRSGRHGRRGGRRARAGVR